MRQAPCFGSRSVRFLVSQKLSRMLPILIEFPPRRICENHGRFNLPFWHCPVLLQEKVLLLGANDLKAMLFVKADRPYRVRPASN